MSIHTKKRSIRVGKVGDILDASTNTIWRWHRTRPDFPRAIRLSPGCTVWNEDEILTWRDAQRAQPVAIDEAAALQVTNAAKATAERQAKRAQTASIET